ncbi:hypothetical protein ILUMI_03456 [Ignelater luminosus]|uniref:HTH CENPB-type domain-containing protein n=1 Tax=Ignelater luminosus TaxID=2038154 RepID=A0A8K0GFH3_IGNLU|nr:hypothetical protein ILUMI_03456 [Ignelater luminosus]
MGENIDLTDGWLTRWKNRHGIVYKKLHGEKQDADEDGARNWIQRTWPNIVLGISTTWMKLASTTRQHLITAWFLKMTLAFKTLYRTDMKKQIICAIDEGKDTANEIAKQISVLDAIHMVDSTWGRVAPQCIANLVVNSEIRKWVEIDCDVPVHHEMDLDEIDNSVVIAEKDSICESDEDDVPVERVPVTRNDVIGAIGVLRRAVEENRLEEQFPVLRKLEVSLENVFLTKQTKITEFFLPK